MDPALSDLLICPRCGPGFGLVLLPHALEERRVVRGVLGCANCRERYPIEHAVADLRTGAEGRGSEGPTEASVWAVPGEEAVRLGALLGLDEAHGTILLAGPAAAHAAAVEALSERVSVVAVGEEPVRDRAGSSIRVSATLPFRTAGLAGAALTGPYAALADEGARVVAPGRRLVLEPLPAGLDTSTLDVVAREGTALVATRR
jgi:uncharacterized protein YbaR (Trm112 family)